MKKLKVAVIGVGKLGSLHAKIYSQMKEVELTGVCDIKAKVAKTVARQCNTAYYTNYRDLLGKQDVVSIAVPTFLHYKIAKDFLMAKTHLLIEKPITTVVKEANSLLSLASKNNLTLCVGHIERFNSAVEVFQKLKGDIRFIECHRLGPFSSRVADVGVVLDLMIHDIDIILGLIKDKIQNIDAVGVNILTKHEDIANARIKFRNGAICNITASRVSAKNLRKIRIFQPGAYISIDYIKQEAILYRKIGRLIIPRKINIKKQQPLKKELSSFIECIKSGKKPLVSGVEGRDALKIALDITKKIHSKTHA
ncbi:MAG: Gfo/Idh/MocA family oxidoreductase [Candidatus Omnitrophota bacterium]|nr:MAG: Gfo/Idh/MocA family oxidoreductase [Candidatus Omnitrophota bacterium]